jgi:hypothetical protein
MGTTPKNGISTKRPRPSNQLVRVTHHWTSNHQVNQPTFKYGAPTQDGGNSSNTKVKTLSILHQESVLMSQETKMKKPKTLWFMEDTMASTKDGKSDT